MQRVNGTATPRLAQPLDSSDQRSLASVPELETSVPKGLAAPHWISKAQRTNDSGAWTIALRHNSSTGNESPGAGTSMTVVEFVERVFIPEYVLRKRAAGRAHFQAILKHIIRPEIIAHAFRPGRKPKVRLKTAPGWPYLDTMQLTEVRPENVARLVEASLSRGYSTQTAAHLRNVIRNIFSCATERGYYDGPNPTAALELPFVDHKTTPVLSLCQFKQVIEFMRYPEQYIASFALLTDMNMAEICGLKWKNVNLSNDPWYKSGVRLPPRTIAVKTQSYRGEYREVIGKRDRVVAINGALYSTLRSLRHRSKFTSDDDFVIASRIGTPVNPDNIAMRRLKRIGKAINMPWLSWKVFHRTRTSLLGQFGGSLNRELERVLGSTSGEAVNTVGTIQNCGLREGHKGGMLDEPEPDIDLPRNPSRRTQSQNVGSTQQVTPFCDSRELPSGTMQLASYVERKFIPDHVLFKTEPGRIHYQAILKHILNPEKVEKMFAPYTAGSISRLRPFPDWPYLDNIRLCDLTADHVRQLTSFASARGYSPQTVKHIRNVLGAVISHARKEGLFKGKNPTSEVELPPIIHRNVQKLTILQTKAVLRRMRHPDRDIALITIATGMGIAEICALQWKHVNLTDTPVYSEGEMIPPQHILVKQHWDQNQILDLPVFRVRKEPIPEPLLHRLSQLRRLWHQFDPQRFVLTLNNGTQVSPAGIRTRLKPVGRQLGLPWLSWPALKRAHQTLIAELRIHLGDELMSTGDKSSIEITSSAQVRTFSARQTRPLRTSSDHADTSSVELRGKASTDFVCQ